MTTRSVSLALGYVAGIVLAAELKQELPLLALVAPVVVGIVWSVLLWKRERVWSPVSPALVITAALLIGVPCGYVRTFGVYGLDTELDARAVLDGVAAGTPLELRGQISREPDVRRPGQTDLRLRVESLRTGNSELWRDVSGGQVLLRVQLRGGRQSPQGLEMYESLSALDAYGYRIQCAVVHRPLPPPLNPGEFDYASFLRQDGVVARFRASAATVKILDRGWGNALTELSLKAKRQFLITYKSTIRAPASRLVAAATLGLRRSVEGVEYRGDEIVDSFRRAGVGHVLAVSGLHVSVVALLLYYLFRSVGLSPRRFAPALVLFLVAFALLTGARPSSVRAVIMNSVVVCAFAYFNMRFRQAVFIGLSLAALIILGGNPHVLFAPSFLLSFGAVLALVLVAPMMDRWMCSLRGFALVFIIGWFIGVLSLASMDLRVLVNAWSCLSVFGALFLLIKCGDELNHAVPRAWMVGLDRLPDGLRMFLTAQIAIQIGMMLPLSAWFFGRFPVAGICVNLLAIPAIGVLVQLGMMTGLVGLIPLVGDTLAMPFGAAVTLVGDFFFWLAHWGGNAFPFPATPRPTNFWMAGYYLLLGSFLLADWHRRDIQKGMYWICGNLFQPRTVRIWSWGLPAALLCLPVFNLLQSPETVREVTVCAVSSYPVVSAVSDRRRAIVLNAGDEYSASRTLFDVIRGQGVSSIRSAVVSGVHPETGHAGFAALAKGIAIEECLVPVVAVDPKLYLAELGDGYLVEKAQAGEEWALNYADAYARLAAEFQRAESPLKLVSDVHVAGWEGFTLRALPAPKELPKRFVSRARAAVMEMIVNGTRWMIVTELDQSRIRYAIAASEGRYDGVIFPDHSTKTGFESVLDDTVRRTNPDVLILSGTREISSLDMDLWRDVHPGLDVVETARHGAIQMRPLDTGGVLLTAFRSGWERHLRRGGAE